MKFATLAGVGMAFALLGLANVELETVATALKEPWKAVNRKK